MSNPSNPSNFDHPINEQVQTGDPGPTITMILNFDRPPLTANDRHHWSKKARLTRNLRQYAAWEATRLRIPTYPRITVSLVWVVKDKRRRDGGENLTPTMKPLIDGLVDAGVVADDDQHHVIRIMPTIDYRPTETPHLELTVGPVVPEARAA